eukprot:2895574-Rhodomonas_salina.1
MHFQSKQYCIPKHSFSQLISHLVHEARGHVAVLDRVVVVRAEDVGGDDRDVLVSGIGNWFQSELNEEWSGS